MSGVFRPTPPPPAPGECVPPAFVAGRGHTRWVEWGVGVTVLEDARHSSVLYICKYFVGMDVVLVSMMREGGLSTFFRMGSKHE
jgi:hypothetical protein